MLNAFYTRESAVPGSVVLGGSQILPGFSQLRGWKMVFVIGARSGGLKIAQDNKSFFKVTPLIWAIVGQNNMSYRVSLDLQKRLLTEGGQRLGWDCSQYFTDNVQNDVSRKPLFISIFWSHAMFFLNATNYTLHDI